MPNESRAPNALLWIILLAVLIEPLALALILDREPPAASPPVSTKAPEAGPSPAASSPAGVSRPFPKPKPGVPVVADAAKRYPRSQVNVDSWVNHERERDAKGGDDDPTLFFHRTTSEILAELGMPNVASESEAGVRWEYVSSDGESSLLLDFHAGRVYRFWFN